MASGKGRRWKGAMGVPHVAGFQGCWRCSVKSAVCVCGIKAPCTYPGLNVCAWVMCSDPSIAFICLHAFIVAPSAARTTWQGVRWVMGKRKGQRHADAACSCLSLIMFGRDAIFALPRTYLCASRACQAAKRREALSRRNHSCSHTLRNLC